jgi:hypothetical protein
MKILGTTNQLAVGASNLLSGGAVGGRLISMFRR